MSTDAQPPRLGITVMPEWFQDEGVDAVLDRVQRLGATAIATSPYLLERVKDGEGAREPPPDGEAGKVRPLDRPLFGARELWVRTAPAFEHDFRRYQGLRYRPSPPTDLTRAQPELLDTVVDVAARRGIAVYFQVMAASPPGYRVQFSGAAADDQCLLPDGTRHDARVDRNASLASSHVVDYVCALLAELAERYPGVAGFRLDWPEYPPYDLASALFDFSPAAVAAMQRTGADPQALARAALGWRDGARTAARNASPGLEAATLKPHFDALLDAQGPLAPLFGAKRAWARALIGAYRRALDRVPGPRRRLEPQAFPPPFDRVSGFPLRELEGIADAVGIKLYTMHWPMIARYWTRDLLGHVDGDDADRIAVAVASHFDLVDEVPAEPWRYRYPDPERPHPAGAQAQRRKLDASHAAAGRVPLIAFAHSYGPIADVVARVATARNGARHVWINRYGYLSDDKLTALSQGRRQDRLPA